MIDTLVTLLSRYGIYGVIVAAFMEAVIFPPPVEIILLPVMIANPTKAILYGTVTVMVSILGSSAGYWLGSAAGKPLLEKMFGSERVKSISAVYDRYGIFAVVTSGFTPIPYEVYTLSAGAFKMDFKKYILAAFAGRILRYMPEGVAVQLLGGAAGYWISKAAGRIFIILVLFVFLYMIIKKFMSYKNRA